VQPGHQLGRLIVSGSFFASGLSLLIREGGGLYVVAVWMVLAFAWNIYVASVLIAEVSE
jgi:hypothetical protein